MNHSLAMINAVAGLQGGGGVLVSVARVRGSGPREVGAWMLVYADRLAGTIGGGNFEFKAIRLAREILAGQAPCAVMQEYPLGPALGQCCGGVVTLLLEPVDDALLRHFQQLGQIARQGRTVLSVVDFDRPGQRFLMTDHIIPESLPGGILQAAAKLLLSGDSQSRCIGNDLDGFFLSQVVCKSETPLYIYGAGHVGRALVRVLLPLDFEIHWVDIRVDEFPEDIDQMALHPHIVADPVSLAALGESGAFHLVLTHDHQIDFEICEALLKKNNFGYLGMIGSDTKRARFVRRFMDRDIGESALDRFICPIGIGEITSKRPAEIAVSVAAELLVQQSDRRRIQNPVETGMDRIFQPTA